MIQTCKEIALHKNTLDVLENLLKRSVITNPKSFRNIRNDIRNVKSEIFSNMLPNPEKKFFMKSYTAFGHILRTSERDFGFVLPIGVPYNYIVLQK